MGGDCRTRWAVLFRWWHAAKVVAGNPAHVGLDQLAIRGRSVGERRHPAKENPRRSPARSEHRSVPYLGARLHPRYAGPLEFSGGAKVGAMVGSRKLLRTD